MRNSLSKEFRGGERESERKRGREGGKKRGGRESVCIYTV